MKKLDWKTCIKVVVSVFVLYLGIHYWPNISSVLGTFFSAGAPIFIGVVMAYAINILMSFYERHYFKKSSKALVLKTRTPVCLVGAIITLIGIIALVIGLVIPQLISCIKMLIAELPGVIDMAIDKLNELDFVPENLIESLYSIDWKSKIGDYAQTITSSLGNVMNFAVSAVTSVVSVVVDFVIGLIFALYLLLDKKNLINRVNRMAKRYIPEKFYLKTSHVLTLANESFHKFIVGQCTEAVILGVLCIIGMLILQLPYAAMIGALVAFTALIPIVGAFIGAGVGAILILTESPTKALIFLIFFVILQQIEGNLIYPKVVGSSIGLPAVWVLAAVTVGGGVLGIGGMMIAVPTAAVIYKLLRENLNKPRQEDIETKQE